MSTLAVSRSNKIGAVWMILASLCFAMMGLFVKLAGSHYGFIELVFWRGVFGSVMMIFLCKAQKGSLKTNKFKQHFSRSISGFVSMLLYFYCIMHLPLATAMTLSYTSPISIVILSIIMYRERVSLLTIVGILVGFVGIILLLQPSFQSDTWVYILLGITGGALTGWAYLQVKELTQLDEPDWRIVFYFSLMLIVGPVIMLTVLGGWHPVTLDSVGYIIGMGITATFAQLFMTKSYATGNKFVNSSLSYLTIVFAIIFGILVLKEILHVTEVVAICVIIASGFITSLGNRKP